MMLIWPRSRAPRTVMHPSNKERLAVHGELAIGHADAVRR